MIFHLPYFVYGSIIPPASLLTSKVADLEMSSSKNYHPTCRPAITWESKTQATTVSNITLRLEWSLSSFPGQGTNNQTNRKTLHQSFRQYKYYSSKILNFNSKKLVYTEISQVTHKKSLKGLVGS